MSLAQRLARSVRVQYPTIKELDSIALTNVYLLLEQGVEAFEVPDQNALTLIALKKRVPPRASIVAPDAQVITVTS